MTTPKKDIELKKENWEDLKDKLSEFELTPVNEEKKNGWQYLFKIEYDDTITLISFMDGKVIMGEKIYEIQNYDANEFLYLFE